MGYEHHPALQVSIINDDRTFVFHDWEHLLGRSAQHMDLDNEDIYDPVFRHADGVLAWFDVSSNVSPGRNAAGLRFNIGVFRSVPRRSWRIMVEAHQSIIAIREGEPT